MNQIPNNDDILFDRLVDGELSDADRRAFLESLDSRPQGWRRCALAFLEAQSWRGELRAAAVNPPASTAAAKSLAQPAPVPRTAIRSAAQWLAVAATVLVAFKLGTMQQFGPQGVASSQPKPAEQLVSVRPTPGAAAASNGKPGDALNLWVRDDAGQVRRLRVPLVDASALDNELGLQFRTGVPDDVRNRLHDNGYAVQSKGQYAPLWLDNGRPMIVPVEDTKIVPVSNKVY